MIAIALTCLAFLAAPPSFSELEEPPKTADAASSLHWPEGTEVLDFEDLEGAILIRATATGASGRDTSGLFVLDTGAGHIALDEILAIHLGVASEPPRGEIAFARSPLTRFRLGNLTIDQAQVLTFDADVIRTVTDRPVLGLLGHDAFRDRALWIDYETKRVALVPVRSAQSTGSGSTVEVSRTSLAGLISSAAIPLPFRMSAGGKVMVRARITPRNGSPTDWLTFVFDTGATKTALFANSADKNDPTSKWRPSLHSLEAPTLMGRSASSLVRAARLQVSAASERSGSNGDAADGPKVERSDVDVLVVHSPLGRELSRVAGETVSGLLGYSFLRRFRVVCDYSHRILWLDPNPRYRDDRPYEHSHAGLQLERRAGVVRVMSVARPSPGQRAGIRPGDEIVTIDRVSAQEASLLELGRMMEGKPGSIVALTIRRGGHDIAYRLRRQRLL